MTIRYTLTKEEADKCRVTLTNIETGKESYYYDYKGMVLMPRQVTIEDEEWSLCLHGMEHEFMGNSRVCYYCSETIPERD